MTFLYALKCSQPNGRSQEISLICVISEAASRLGFANVKPHQLEAMVDNVAIIP